jgi:hypothetical protein
VLLALALALPPIPPLADVRVNEPIPRVYHLDFPTRRRLASAFMRFQESYESPRFHGKVFTRAEFLAWYGKSPKGTKSDYYDWDGFNLPSRALKPFYAGAYDPLDADERALLALFAGVKGDFYVIGTSGKGSDAGTLRHELAHGRYAVDARYRAAARALLKEVELAPVFSMLERLGYDRSVWEDEAHAWLGDEDEDLRAEGLDPAPYRAVKAKLRALPRR